MPYYIYCHTHTIPPRTTPPSPHHREKRGSVPHPHHTTRGKGTVLWLTHDHGRGGLERWTIYIYIHIYICMYVCMYINTHTYTPEIASFQRGNCAKMKMMIKAACCQTKPCGQMRKWVVTDEISQLYRIVPIVGQISQ